MPRPTRWISWRAAVAALVSVALVAVAAPAGASGRTGSDPEYRPPVDAPVVDPFRPPERPYGPGNRGLEYGTEPGTEVRAAADGVVTFAGLVAGSRHVTVRHRDGLRTTVSYLETVVVLVGQPVEQGDVLGTTAGRLHFSARRGDAYLDPASLFGDGPPRVRLVPFDDPPGDGPAGEQSAIRQLIGIGGAVLGAAASAVGTGVDAGLDLAAGAVDRTAELARLAAQYGPYYVPLARTALMVWRTVEVVQRARATASRPCTGDGATVDPPPERRVAVLVAGLGSTSESGSIDELDVDELGYDAGDVVRFSYAGGRSRYGKPESQQDLRVSGAHLADLIEGVVADAGGVPVDLYAHSQGGVVARLALIELEDRHGRSWLARLGLVATLGSPHGGADAATLVRGVGLSPLGDGVLLEAAEPLVDLDDDAPSTAQLSETSDIVRELADHPVPEEVRTISVAARGDPVVPVPRARFEGAREVVVPLVGPSAHSDLVGDSRTTRELRLALAGLPPVCTSFASALADQAVGTGISWAEDAVGAALSLPHMAG